MEKDKRMIGVENSRSLVRVGVQFGLIAKILEENVFLKQHMIALKCRCYEYDFILETPLEIETIFEIDINSTSLDLSSKRILVLPNEIGLLKELKELNLKSNLLHNLPNEIGQLTNLKILNLESNELSNLPVEIGKLINLEKLNISTNDISCFPNSISNLVNLKELDFSINKKIEKLPDGIDNLVNLEKLIANGCSII